MAFLLHMVHLLPPEKPVWLLVASDGRRTCEPTARSPVHDWHRPVLALQSKQLRDGRVRCTNHDVKAVVQQGAVRPYVNSASPVFSPCSPADRPDVRPKTSWARAPRCPALRFVRANAVKQAAVRTPSGPEIAEAEGDRVERADADRIEPAGSGSRLVTVQTWDTTGSKPRGQKVVAFPRSDVGRDPESSFAHRCRHQTS